MRDFIAMSTAMVVKVFSVSLDPASITAFGGAVVGIGTLIFSLYKYRQGQKGKEADAHAAALDRKAVLDKQIDERIAGQLEGAWIKITELEKKIESLIQSETRTRGENSRLKQVVKWWFEDLLFWDHRGRDGNIPLPSEDNMSLLELELPDNTAGIAHIREARDKYLQDRE